MTPMDLIMENLNEVLLYKQTFNENTEQGVFNKITSPLVTLESNLREVMQAATSEEISVIIEKLEQDAPITDVDMKSIRLWIVGDAESYIRMENDYQGWLEELNRLFLVLEDLQSKEITLESMGKISGTTRDAIRVIGDILYFKQQKERVDNFENASQDLNQSNKLVLAGILRQKLISDQM